MSYRFRACQSVRANVRRVARDRLDDAIEALEAAARGVAVNEQVHALEPAVLADQVASWFEAWQDAGDAPALPHPLTRIAAD